MVMMIASVANEPNLPAPRAMKCSRQSAATITRARARGTSTQRARDDCLAGPSLRPLTHMAPGGKNIDKIPPEFKITARFSEMMGSEETRPRFGPGAVVRLVRR